MQKFPRNQTELVHVKRQRTMGPKYCYAGSSELVYNVGTMMELVKGLLRSWLRCVSKWNMFTWDRKRTVSDGRSLATNSQDDCPIRRD